MAMDLFILQSQKFSTDDIETVLVCSHCDEAFKKKFPLALEGQITEFKCPVCGNTGGVDLPYKPGEKRERLDEDLADVEDEQLLEEEFEGAY